jgi:hypothetical protein
MTLLRKLQHDNEKALARGRQLADGAVAGSPSGPSWVGETLDGSGAWSLRSKAPWIIGLLMLFDSWDSTVIA